MHAAKDMAAANAAAICGWNRFMVGTAACRRRAPRGGRSRKPTHRPLRELAGPVRRQPGVLCPRGRARVRDTGGEVCSTLRVIWTRSANSHTGRRLCFCRIVFPLPERGRPQMESGPSEMPPSRSLTGSRRNRCRHSCGRDGSPARHLLLGVPNLKRSCNPERGSSAHYHLSGRHGKTGDAPELVLLGPIL